MFRRLCNLIQFLDIEGNLRTLSKNADHRGKDWSIQVHHITLAQQKTHINESQKTSHGVGDDIGNSSPTNDQHLKNIKTI